MENIYKKSKKSFIWTTVSNGIKGGLGLLTLFVLTYYLGVEKMGIISILTVIYGFSETFVQFGISQSIIARENNTKKELTSIFWTNLVIGFFVFIIINLLALPISNFYNQPDLFLFIRVLSFIFLIEPLDLVFRAILEKNLDFSKLEKVNILRYSLFFLVVFILLSFNFGVISYVYGMIVSILISTLAFLFIFIRNKYWLPTFHYNFKEIKAHYSFGFYVTAKSFLNYAGRNFDELIVGKILGLEVLGLYHFAKNIVDKPVKLFSNSFSKVSFPFYSKFKNNIDDLKNYYLKFTEIISFFGIFILGYVFVFSPSVINYFFDEIWHDSIILVQLFTLISFIYLLSTGFSTSIIYIFNKPQKVFYIDLIITPIRLTLVFLGALFDIRLVLIFLFFSILYKSILLQKIVNKKLNLTFNKYFKIIFNNFILITLPVLIMYILNYYIYPFSFFEIIFYTILYISIFFILILNIKKSILKIIKNLIKI